MPNEQFSGAPKTELANPRRQLGGDITPTAVILHRTIGSWPGDLSVGTNGGAPGYVSFHFLVGQDAGQWTQFVGPNGEGVGHLMNHAAGQPGNGNAFGIEISGQQDDPLTDWQVDRVAAILQWARDEWGIPPVKYDGAQGRIDSWSGAIDHRHIVAPSQFAHYDGVEDADWARIAAKIAGGTIAPAPAPAPGPAPAGDRMLRQGMTGSDVAELQRQLGIMADGIFGPQTDAAVRAFQAAHGCQVDGIVGPQTRAALAGNAPAPAGSSRMLKQGDRGDDVRAVQQALVNAGETPGPADGIFGPLTDASVRRYQAAHNLQIDGIVGPQTRGSLGI